MLYKKILNQTQHKKKLSAIYSTKHVNRILMREVQ